jgi:hypothetical protein
MDTSTVEINYKGGKINFLRVMSFNLRFSKNPNELIIECMERMFQISSANYMKLCYQKNKRESEICQQTLISVYSTRSTTWTVQFNQSRRANAMLLEHRQYFPTIASSQMIILQEIHWKERNGRQL